MRPIPSIIFSLIILKILAIPARLWYLYPVFALLFFAIAFDAEAEPMNIKFRLPIVDFKRYFR